LENMNNFINLKYNLSPEMDTAEHKGENKA
jgi:hypothetical protein